MIKLSFILFIVFLNLHSAENEQKIASQASPFIILRFSPVFKEGQWSNAHCGLDQMTADYIGFIKKLLRKNSHKNVIIVNLEEFDYENFWKIVEIIRSYIIPKIHGYSKDQVINYLIEKLVNEILSGPDIIEFYRDCFDLSVEYLTIALAKIIANCAHINDSSQLVLLNYLDESLSIAQLSLISPEYNKLFIDKNPIEPLIYERIKENEEQEYELYLKRRKKLEKPKSKTRLNLIQTTRKR